MAREELAETIETERLRLRLWEFGDADDLFEFAKESEWRRYLHSVPDPYTRVDADRFVAKQVLLDRTSHAAWATVYEDAVVGGVSLRFDPDNGSAELGYSIAPRLRGQGLCVEAASAVIDIAFSSYSDLIRIHARADRRNVASHRVMEKLGMQKEGMMRSSRILRGEVIDEVWYAILRQEWE